MEFDYSKLAEELVKVLPQKDPAPKVEEVKVDEPTPTPLERMKEQERIKDDARKNEERIRSDLQYDMTFDALIEKHEAAFGKTAKDFRAMAPEDMDPAHRVRLLKVLTAQQYFDKPEHRDFLTGPDKSYVEQFVLNKHESSVDVARTQAILDQALNVQSRLDYQTALRNGNTSTGKQDPYAGYFKRCAALCGA